MKRLLTSIAISAILAVVFHIIPLWNDSFTVNFSKGQYLKTFCCGWPLHYTIPAEPGSAMAPLKVLLNVAGVAAGVLLIKTALNCRRTRTPKGI